MPRHQVTIEERCVHFTNEQIERLYHDPTLTVEDAAKMLGISGPSLSKLARLRGIKTRAEVGIGGKMPSTCTKEQLERLFKKHSCIEDVADALGVGRNCIYSLSIDYGIVDMRPPTRRKLLRSAGIITGNSRHCAPSCKSWEWCKANLDADRLPCELEATPKAAHRSLNFFPTFKWGGGIE